MSTVKPITARRRLELSRINPAAVQRELMGRNVGITSLIVYLEGLVQTNLAGRITKAEVERTIEGASSITIEIDDYDRKVLRSGLLTQRFDIKIDGLWFRLTEIDKSDNTVSLIFQDREVEILRTYNSWRIAQRGQLTRAEFVLSMIREVKEFDIPVVIPELHKVQAIEKYQGDLTGADATVTKSQGIPADINQQTPKDVYNHRDTLAKRKSPLLTVKGSIATPTQIRNANIILAVANELGVSRRLKIVSIMTAIDESSITAIPDQAHGGRSDADSAGIFQQRPGWGSYLERIDVETSARLFFNGNPQKHVKGAIAVEKDNLGEPYWFIAAEVQRPREDLRTKYAKYRTEAERFVNASGDVSTSVNLANNMSTPVDAFGANGPFYFYRGKIVDRRGQKIRQPENSWACSQRLGDEVDWRSFFVSGTYYFISDDDLFKQTPLATISEFSPGIQSLDGNYDNHKKSATIEIKARVGRWQIPPGGVVVVQDCGPFDGRWLVNDFSRDLVDSDIDATITLKKPRPVLPEPLASNAADLGTGVTWAPNVATDPPPTKDLITQVLQNPNIVLTQSQRSDITFGQIYDPVLSFMLWMVARGYAIRISALKSDHAVHTSEGGVSAHSAGKAVDIDEINGIAIASNDTTSQIMDLLAQYQFQLQFDQLIGPFPMKVIPLGRYDGKVLSEHRTHIHTGWKI